MYANAATMNCTTVLDFSDANNAYTNKYCWQVAGALAALISRLAVLSIRMHQSHTRADNLAKYAHPLNTHGGSATTGLAISQNIVP